MDIDWKFLLDSRSSTGPLPLALVKEMENYADIIERPALWTFSRDTLPRFAYLCVSVCYVRLVRNSS